MTEPETVPKKRISGIARIRNYFLTAGEDSRISLWDVEDHKLLRTQQLPDVACCCQV